MQRSRGPVRKRARPRNRGSAANALLVTVCALVTAGLSIAVVRPRLVGGAEERAALADFTATDPVHQSVIEQIARLVGSSREVLFQNDNDRSPFREVLLWMTDGENPGQVDAAELALLSYSSTLQAISVYVWEPRNDSAIHDMQPKTPAARSADDLRNADFCRGWRTQPGVARHTIATHVREVQWGSPDGYRPSDSLWRIALTWASESADLSDTASITVTIGAR